MRLTGIVLVALGLLAASTAAATEVYRWVDSNGVVHFSQNEPAGKVGPVEKMILEDTTPPDYDPEEDLYGVEALAEEMALLREEMAEKREQAEERQFNAPQQHVVQYQQPVNYGYPFYGRPPYFPGARPPMRPQPRPEPYPSFPFRPPGQK